jgi:hypothetical protein
MARPTPGCMDVERCGMVRAGTSVGNGTAFLDQLVCSPVRRLGAYRARHPSGNFAGFSTGAPDKPSTRHLMGLPQRR